MTFRRSCAKEIGKLLLVSPEQLEVAVVSRSFDGTDAVTFPGVRERVADFQGLVLKFNELRKSIEGIDDPAGKESTLKAESLKAIETQGILDENADRVTELVLAEITALFGLLNADKPPPKRSLIAQLIGAFSDMLTEEADPDQRATAGGKTER